MREKERVCVCVRERENGRVPISTWMYFLNGSSTAARSFVIFISILIMEEKFEIFPFFSIVELKKTFSHFSLFLNCFGSRKSDRNENFLMMSYEAT